MLIGGLAVGALAAVAITGAAPASQADATPTLSDFSLVSYTSDTATAVADPLPAEATAARDAVTAADASLAAADTLASDVSAAGLDLGDTTVDTTGLQTAADRLEKAEALAAPFLPGFTDDVTALTARVDARVSELRGALDGALAKKAEEEAAEKARQEAEAAAQAAAEAAAQAQATQTSAAPAPAPIPSGGGGGDNSPGGAQASAYAMLGNYGWGDDQFSCLVALWNKESGWNYQAYNSGSGAFGIPQALPGSKMASAGGDWASNAATQVAWGLGYISGRYGSPCGAWDHSQSVGWY